MKKIENGKKEKITKTNKNNTKTISTTTLLHKIILIITIIAILASDCSLFSFGLISYAAEKEIASNVKFETNFINEKGEKVKTINQTSRNKNQKMQIEISVENQGYFNGEIELKESNFKIKDTILSDEILEIKENKIKLKQINSGETVKIEVEIEILEPENLSIDQLTKESTLKLTGTYVQEKAKKLEIDLTEKITLNLIVDDQAQAELQTEIITNQILKIEEQNKRIIQLLVKSRISENEYPIKQTTININIPQISNQKPEKVEVFSLGTQATNNEQVGNIEQETTKEQTIKNTNIKQNSEAGQLQITTKNEANENNQITWNKNAYDTFIITFIYDEKVKPENTEIKVNTQINLYDAKNKTLETNSSCKIGKEELNNTLIIKQETKEKELYKGKLYANISATEKQNIQYETETKIYIPKTKIVNKVEIKETADKFITETSELAANTKYISTKINIKKLQEILGTNGYITINTGNNTIKVDSKYIEENQENITQEGEINILYPENTTELQITTTEPVKQGEIKLTHKKEIQENQYSRQQIQEIKTLKNTVTLLGNKDETEILKNTSEYTINMVEPITKAELTVDKEELSTMQENNVIIGVKLITENEKYNLYKNPVIRIQLPEEVESIQLNNADKLYAEGFEIKAQYDKTNKVILLKLIGEQTQYPDTSAIQIYLQLDLTIKLSKYAPKSTKKITMQYINENAISYYGETGENTEKGIVEKEIEISAQSGLITMYETDNQKSDIQISAEDSEKTIQFKTAIINNTKEPIKNLKTMYKLPTSGNKVEEIENTLSTTLTWAKAENAKIYYTENVNATEDIQNEANGWKTNLEEAPNAKMMLVEIEELKAESNYFIEYEIKLPKLIEKNLEASTEYTIKYNTEAVENQEIRSEKITIQTPTEIIMGTQIKAEVGNNEIKNGETVKIGEVIKYTVSVTNKGTGTLKNITLKGLVPNGTVLVEPEKDYQHTGESYYTEITDQKEKQYNIETLKANETYTAEYEVRAKEETNTVENKASATCQDKMVESQKTTNKIEASKIRVTVKSITEGQKYTNSEASYLVFVENTSNADIQNIKLNVNISGIDVENVELDNNENIKEENQTYTISTLPANMSTYIVINGKSKQNENQITLYATVENNSEICRSNKITEKVLKNDVTVSLKSEIFAIGDENQGQNVNQGDTIIYTITLKNIGEVETQVNITDQISDYLEVYSIYVDGQEQEEAENYVFRIETLKPNQEKTIQVLAKVKDLYYKQFKTLDVTNQVQIIGTGFEKKSEIVTHTILGIKGINYDISDENIEIPSPDEDTESNIITGIAWLDKNMNGEKDEGDTVLQGIKVRIYDVSTNDYLKDENGNIIETVTNSNGEYSFTEISKGAYIILFEYDTNLYDVTTYKKAGVPESQNSNVVSKNINIAGEELLYALTDIIDVEKNVTNINAGLKIRQNFDMELNKYISKISIQNNKETRTIECNNSKFEKVEIAAKKINNTLVVIEYAIEIKNTGDVSGYIGSIVDYLPEGLEFNSEINTQWYLLDNNLYTNELSNTEIKPGETKTVNLVLTKSMNDNNVGLVNNRAEIAESYNENGIPDRDSTVANQVNEEDDLGAADIYIGIKTGETTLITITLIMGCIILIIIYIKIQKIKNMSLSSKSKEVNF